VSEVLALGDVADVVAGVGFPKDMQGGQDGAIPVFKVGDISAAWLQGKSLLNDSRNYLSAEEAKLLGKCVPAGATVFAKIGEALRLNRRVMLGRDALVDNNVMGLVPMRERVAPKYLYYFMQTVDLGELSRSTTVPSIRKSDVVDIRIPVPDLTAQDEIVAELEKQFSRLDEAVANLQRVKANLKRYKASVLKAAVEGRLVENEASLASREARTYETGEQLLQRILEERRARLAGKGKFKIPKKPSGSDLPELPEGWIWSSFEAVADRVTVGHVGSMKNEYVEKGVPFLRSQNVRPNRFDPEGLKYITDEFHASLAKSALSPGDIAVVRSGSVGISCVIPDALPVANCSDLVIIKSPRGVESHYGAYYLNSVVESRIAAGRVGVALVHFNTQSVAELPLPLPPMAEQRRIAAEVDRHVSIIREVEAEVDANLQRAQALRQATLAKAFTSSPQFISSV
jgi:type I restriction enzyme, S subunit